MAVLERLPIDEEIPGGIGHGETLGGAGPFDVIATDPRGRWIVICQAVRDDDGDGIIAAVRASPGGMFVGDRAHLLLVLGSGAGVDIDIFEAASPTGDKLAIVRHGKLKVLDIVSRSLVALPTEDLRSKAVPFAMLSQDGERIVYLAGDVLTSYDLESLRGTSVHTKLLITGFDSHNEENSTLLAGVVTTRASGEAIPALYPLHHDCSLTGFVDGTDTAQQVLLPIDLGTGTVVSDGGPGRAPNVPASFTPEIAPDGRPVILRVDDRELVAAGVFSPEQAPASLKWRPEQLRSMLVGPMTWRTRQHP